MRRIAIVVAHLALAPFCAAQGVEFSANHLFVSDLFGSRVLEFDESGAYLGAIDTSADAPSATGLAFGADGLLYVGSGLTDDIALYDHAGNVAGSFAHASMTQVEAVNFDTTGRLLVTTYTFGDLVRLSADGSSATTLYDGNSPLLDLEIDAYGRLVTSDSGAGFARFLDVDGSGALSNQASLALAPPAVLPRGIAVERSFRVSNADSASDRVLLHTNTTGSAPTAISVSAAPITVEDADYGPDGRLYVATAATGTVVAIDVTQSVVAPFATAPAGPAPYLLYMTFAPFYFDAVVKGRARAGNGAIVPIAETVVVSIQPASRCVSVMFTDDPQKPNDFVSVTGLDRFITYGEASAFSAPGSLRSIHAHAPRSTSAIDDVTVVCDTKRKIDANGFERVVSATGALWCGGADQQVHLSFKTKKLRNP